MGKDHRCEIQCWKFLRFRNVFRLIIIRYYWNGIVNDVIAIVSDVVFKYTSRRQETLLLLKNTTGRQNKDTAFG